MNDHAAAQPRAAWEPGRLDPDLRSVEYLQVHALSGPGEVPRARRSPPAGLSKHSGSLWRTVLRDHDLSATGRELLRQACLALDRADDAATTVMREGTIVADRDGMPKAHPATDIEARSRAAFASIVKLLGLESRRGSQNRRRRRVSTGQQERDGGTSTLRRLHEPPQGSRA
jgi:hypothetical protein